MTTKLNQKNEAAILKPSTLNPTQNIPVAKAGTALNTRRQIFQNKHWDEIFRRALQAEQLLSLPALHT